MPGSPQNPRYDNPNAPKIPPGVYPYEKGKLAGVISCAIFYGFVVILFFQCMGALFDPVNRARGSIRQLLVAHTIAMFFFVTIYTAANLSILSISYVDNRGFPGINKLPIGPLGYQYLAYTKATGVISTGMFLLNNWLADGLLLYRCYIIYAMNYWAIILPFLIYLATFAMGIMLVYYQISHPSCTIWRSGTINIGIPYSVSISLNVLITLMIVGRLVLLCREIQNTINAPFRLGGLYKAVVTVLSESSALYAITFLLLIGTWAANNPAEFFFWPILAQTQVIAPFWIVLRVANRRALMSDAESGDISSMCIIQGESMDGGRIPPDGHPTNSVTNGKVPGGFSVRSVTSVDLCHGET